jgi:molybdenum cofactor cytidylyltransferase
VPLLHYERIVGSFQRLQTPDALVVSSSGETIGPPVLFGPRYRPQLEEMSGESGARAIIQANESQMTVVMGQEGWFRDLDGPEDFEINPLMNR